MVANAASGAGAPTGTEAAKVADSPLTEKASAAAHSAIDEVAERAARTESRLRSTATERKHDLMAKRDHLEGEFESAREKVENFARENPVATIGIAFAAGVLISSWLKK